LPGTPLGPAVRRLADDRDAVRRAGLRVIDRVDPSQLADQLFDELESAATSNRRRR
jgi:hypothetical protein